VRERRWELREDWRVRAAPGALGPLSIGMGIGLVLHGHWWGYLLIAAGSALLVPYWVREYGPAIRRWRARRRAAAAAIHYHNARTAELQAQTRESINPDREG
jgi:hypothetical protein